MQNSLIPVMKKIENQKYLKSSFLAENRNHLRIFISQPISKIPKDLRPMRHAIPLFTTREKLSKFDSPQYPLVVVFRADKKGNFFNVMAECILWLWAILRDVWRNGIFLLHLDSFCEESSQVGLRVTNGIRKARLSSLSISSLVHFGNISNLLMIYCPLRKKSRLLSKLTVIFPPRKICHFSGGSPLGNISF